MKDPFGRGRDAARREELERQAQEEVERLTRRPPGGGGGMGGGGMGGGMGGGGGMRGGGAGIGPPSPLEMMAQQMRERRTSRRRDETRGDGFTDSAGTRGRAIPAGLISGSVGSGFGPAGLNPGPAFARAMNPQPPPSAFEEPAFEGAMGRSQQYQPPIPRGDEEEIEEEAMSVTEIALMDHAARSGSKPEDLVVQYDPVSAEDARDKAMAKFRDRQKRQLPSRPITAGMAKDPFMPAAMRNQASAAIAQARASGPPPTPTVGGALGRLAAQRRQESKSAAPVRRALPAPKKASPTTEAPPPAPTAPPGSGGALSRLLERRAQEAAEAAASLQRPSAAPGRLHSMQRARSQAFAPDPEPDTIASESTDKAPAATKAPRAKKTVARKIPGEATAAAPAKKTPVRKTPPKPS